MKKFPHLDVPYQWEEYWTKYPHGYTIFEALCSWTKQVNSMVDNQNTWNDYLDNFVKTFEFELQEEVQSTIEKWQNEGLLDGIIESALNTELDNVKTQLAHTHDDLKDRGINIKTLYNISENEDITDKLQNAIDTYKHIFIPDGDYVIDNLVLKDDYKITANKGANITVLGNITNESATVKEYNKPITSTSSLGDKRVTVTNTSDVSIGDAILVYNGGYLSEPQWIEDSKNENTYRMRKQLAIITNIVGNDIYLDRELDFPINHDRGTPHIEYFNANKNIVIDGGVFYPRNTKLFVFKNIINSTVKNIDINATDYEVSRPFEVEYAYDVSIENNRLDSIKNGFIWLARHCNNVKITHNILEVKDNVSLDATILVYDYCKNVTVSNNRLTMFRDNDFLNTNMSGITIHTDSFNCVVSDNEVVGYYYGIASYFGCKYNVYTNNRIMHCVGGLALHGADYENIINNTIIGCGLDDTSYSLNRGGVVLLANYPSNRITIENNLISENRVGIRIASNTRGTQINNNTFIDNLGETITSEQINVVGVRIIGNSFKQNDTPRIAISTYGNWTECVFHSNHFENVTYAIRFFNAVKHSIITHNVVTTCSTFILLRFASNYNQIKDNTIVDCSGVAIDRENPASVNNYQNNTFIDVETKYGFSDLDNLSTTALDRAPVGFKVYSVEHGNTIYFEKLDNGLKGHSGWQRVVKNTESV